jgi:hypothetical protein
MPQIRSRDWESFLDERDRLNNEIVCLREALYVMIGFCALYPKEWATYCAEHHRKKVNVKKMVEGDLYVQA